MALYEGKIMDWRNGQTAHPSLHLRHLLAQWGVRVQVSNGEVTGFRSAKETESVLWLRGAARAWQASWQGVWMALRSTELHQRLHLEEDCLTGISRAVEKSLVKAPALVTKLPEVSEVAETVHSRKGLPQGICNNL